MDRFFYYALGLMAAVLIVAFGVVFYSQNTPLPANDDDEPSVALDRPRVTPTPASDPVSTIDEGRLASSLPVAITTPTPTPERLPWSPPNAGELLAIQYPGFSVVYSTTLGNPLAVQYAMVNNAKPRRWPDPPRVETPARSRITDAGFAAGPMALPHSIALYFGKEAEKNTALMTNTCAFFPAALAGPWNQFAELEQRWAGEFGWIEVVAGPIFSNPPRHTQDGLIVPSAFYRVYRRSYGDTLAFIIPQAATSPEINEFLTSIAAVEASTGLTVFSDTILPEARGTVAAEIW